MKKKNSNNETSNSLLRTLHSCEHNNIMRKNVGLF